MRQFLLRLLLLALVVLVIFGVYRLLTVRPLADIPFFRDQPGLAALDGNALPAAPPYSATSFDAARQAGANSLYLPVTLTHDGVLVVTDADVSERTLAELTASAAAGSLMTLPEALAAYPDLRAVVHLRRPSLQALAALLQAVDAAAARSRVLAVVDHPVLVNTLREQAPDLATTTTSAETNAFLATRRLRLTPFYRPAAPALLLTADQINQGLVEAAHSRGIHVIARLAGQDSASAQALLATGVDGVIATDPALLAALRWPDQSP